MNLRIYKISFNKNIYDSFYEFLSDIEKSKINTLDISGSFTYNIEEKCVVYLLMPYSDMENYKSILDKNLIPYLCNDFSEIVINGEVNLEFELESYIDFYNYVDYDNFIYLTNQWILSNLELDPILDRISQYGVETLRPIDKEFLKSV